MEIQSLLIHQGIENFSRQIKENIAAELKLNQQEKAFLKKAGESEMLNYEAFIPDHLEFGCQTGRLLYRVVLPPLESFWILPKP